MTAWRGWDAADPTRSVVSARLGAGASVRNQLFPKTRSWFALGAPLELMSPLSLLRIVVALDAVVELALGLSLARPGAFSMLLAIGLGTLALRLSLLPVKAPGAPACALLVVGSELSVAGLVWSGPGGAVSIGYAALLVPSCCVAPLFPLRRTLGLLGLAVVLLLVATAPRSGAGAALAGAAGFAAGASASTLTIWLLTRNGARRRQVDPDTGLPNGFGLAVSPFDGDDVEDLVRRASVSAAQAPTSAPVAVRLDSSRTAMTAADLALLAGLAQAGRRGELSLAYQPQISASRREPVGVEALLRWTSPTAGPVPPGRFVVLAERTGLIERLTDWVLAEALDAQVRWRASGLAVPVAVNVSARSLSRPELADLVLTALGARSLPASCLTLEVTETAAAADLGAAVRLLRPLHEAGVRISIDDFGTGFTSLAVLPELPLRELKVDQRFVRRAATSGADAAIVATVGELARRLGLDAVAEGVEDEAACRFLVDLTYDLLQGFHFARPLVEADLLDYLATAAPLLAPGAARSP